MSEGFYWLDRAASGDEMTVYHLEAAIAAAHAGAENFASTDWPYVLAIYDDLYRLRPTPVIALNRCVALGRVEGPRAAIEAIESMPDRESLARYFPAHAALGALWQELGDHREAIKHFRGAMECSCSDAEKRFLEEKLAEGERALSMGEKG
jgi:RNA polymerase sigma-70 factor (ECF subfamily)